MRAGNEDLIEYLESIGGQQGNKGEIDQIMRYTSLGDQNALRKLKFKGLNLNIKD